MAGPSAAHQVLVCQAVRVPILAGVTVLAAVAWVYLLAGHGGYWRTDQRLPGGGPDPATRPNDSGPSESWPEASWPTVVAVVPARNEAAVLPLSLPSLVTQDYPGEFSVVLVDDGSTDYTATVATALGREAAALGQGPGERRALRVVAGSPVPPGWTSAVSAPGVKAMSASVNNRKSHVPAASTPWAMAQTLPAQPGGTGFPATTRSARRSPGP